MSVRSAKDRIREARKQAGLTQEQLADGICSPQALSRIETGNSGVSHATFHALMKRTGTFDSRFPVFASRKAFNCYCSLLYAGFFLNNWQLSNAWEELKKVEAAGWADNRLYYQKWLYLQCRLQFLSGQGLHEGNRQILMAALKLSRPDMDISRFHDLLLSQAEIGILTLLAEESLYLNDIETCSGLCDQLDRHLSHTTFSSIEWKRLRANLAIVQTKLLMAQKSYDKALKIGKRLRTDTAHRENPSILFPLFFLSGLCSLYLQDLQSADEDIKTAFYSAHGFGSCYSTLCRCFLSRYTSYVITGDMMSLPDIPLIRYPVPSPLDASAFSEEEEEHLVYTLGAMIHDLRTEQKVSQEILCLGLCSPSKLSKIENGSLLPAIALLEALLQRLGISERIFEFWGDEKDVLFHRLKLKLLNGTNSPEKQAAYLKEMEQLLEEHDSLYRQRYLTVRASLSSSPEEQIHLLEEALHITIPDFRISDISHYRLSWEEISILNHIASAYSHTQNRYLSSVYFSQLLEYKDRLKPHPLYQSNTFADTLTQHCCSLFAQKQYQAILDLYQSCDKQLLNCRISTYQSFLFYYSQALAACGDNEKPHLYALYSNHIKRLTGSG